MRPKMAHWQERSDAYRQYGRASRCTSRPFSPHPRGTMPDLTARLVSDLVRTPGTAFDRLLPDRSNPAASRPCDACPHALFFRLCRECERISGAAAGFGTLRRLGLGDVLGEHGDHAGAAPMRREHDAVGLLLVHAEHRLEDADDELAWRVVVIEENDLVQPRPLGLGPHLDARPGRDVAHRASCQEHMDPSIGTRDPAREASYPTNRLTISRKASPRRTERRFTNSALSDVSRRASR